MKVGTIHPYDHLYIDPILATMKLRDLRSYFSFEPSWKSFDVRSVQKFFTTVGV